MVPHRQLRRLGIVLTAVVLAFCTERSSAPMGPQTTDAPLAAKGQPTTGTINVTTTTHGVELDPDGYTVTVDSVGSKSASKTIPDSGTAKFANVNTGTRTVTLSGLASNCSTPTNPQKVQLAAGATVTVSFAVTCAATTGTLSVSTSTSGADLDADGYTVTVDGNSAGAKAIAVNGSVTFTTLAPGSHTVALSGLAANCSTTSAQQTVSITAGQTTSASFAVSCATTHGDLTVTTATSGADLDPDGYTLSLDGGTAQAIATNGSLTFTALSAGSHTLSLAGVAANCSVSGGSTQTATVTAGATTSVAFTITCTAIPTTGDLTVTVATTGVELDPDGYSVSVDGGAAQAIAINGSLTIAGLTAGTHSVSLSGLASNCSATANPQSTTIVAGSATTLRFDVACVATTGSLSVATTTTGADLDPDGYGVSVDGGAPQSIGVNGTITISSLAAGAHSVALSGVAANCTVSGPNPQSVTVTAGAMASASFTIGCAAIPTTGDLTVTAATTGVEQDADGYAVSVDGGAGQAIASNGSLTIPSLSPGAHTLTLSGVAANCAVAANPQTATITAGSTTDLSFSISCVTTKGSLSVSTSTTGADLDPDGFTLAVDGGAAQSIGVNGTITISDLAAGSHSITLGGLAANCSTSDNPRTVTVSAGATTAASFTVTCAAIATTGDLTVTATTTGVELDADGYTATVDGGSSQSLAIDGSVSFGALSAGTHTVALSGLAPNCSTTSSQQSVTIVAGSTTSVSFTVGCVTTHGSLTVTTATTGGDLDPDGYTVTVESPASVSQTVGVNGSVSFTDLAAGTHTVTLSGIAANCTVSGSNPQSVTITAGATTSASFAVTCTAVPTRGDLTVDATTTGVELDADGYGVSVDGGSAQSLAINGSLSIASLAAGTHTVTLSGVAPNCTVTSANPQTATIAAGSTTDVAFTISCVTTKGSLSVSTSTTGADVDPDGYTLTLDGSDARAVQANGALTLANLAAGQHTVTLSGVAANCTVSGSDAQTVSITAGATTSVSFAITCAAIPTSGDLTVSATTSGVELDGDGYAVSVDGGSSKSLAINGSTTFPGLSAGSHSIALSGLAPNCTTSTPNPQTVTITAGSTATASFDVTCATTKGTIVVSTSTSGADLDADGYTLSLDGGAAQAIATNGSLTFTGLSAGSHTLALAGVAANCAVSGASSQTVTVTAGATTSAGFTVTCTAIPTTGDLTVTATTTGVELDADGYAVSVDGGSAQALAINGSVTFPGLGAGTHTVTLSGLAPNCTATARQQTVTIVAGSSATATFTVSCVTTHGDLSVTVSTTGVELDPDGYTVSVDGGTAQSIAVNGSLTISGLAAGSHTVTLGGLAANCSVASTSQTVSVTAGATSSVSFSVSCAATKGAIAVTTATTGADLDPDGYTVSLDGGAAQSIAVNGSLTFTNLAPGSHSVSLGGLAANCATTGNPRTVSVTAGATASADFAITCTAIPTTGDLTVTASTSGASLDPDGYMVSVDGGTGQAIAINGSVSFLRLSPGSHSVALSGLASNCSTTSANPQTVGITAGATTTASFTVTCTAIQPTTYTLVGAGDVAGCTWTDDDSTARVLDGVVAADPAATIFIAGDIEYDAATAAEYASCFQPSWGRHKPRTWVALGNHEYKIDPNPTWDYFGDRAGPRGLGYYSFNLGAYWHVIVLSDNVAYGGPDRAAGSAQDTWLQADLAANTRPCTIAIWHQPYVASDGWLSGSRKIFWDRLYAAGAEIVLNGHLHDYERLAPQTPDLVRDDAKGIRAFVVGTGGATTSLPGTLTRNTQVVGESHGVLKLTLGQGTYSWEFLRASGPKFTDSGSGTCH